MEKIKKLIPGNISREQALEMLKNIEKVGQQSAIVCANYLTAIEFIESKGFLQQFSEFLVSKTRIN